MVGPQKNNPSSDLLCMRRLWMFFKHCRKMKEENYVYLKRLKTCYVHAHREQVHKARMNYLRQEFGTDVARLMGFGDPDHDGVQTFEYRERDGETQHALLLEDVWSCQKNPQISKLKREQLQKMRIEKNLAVGQVGDDAAFKVTSISKV